MGKVALLLVALLAVVLAQTEPSIKEVALMESCRAQQETDSYAYYSLRFNTTKKMLMLTLDTTPNTLVNMFLSVHLGNSNQVYYVRPNETHHTQECDQSSFQTCVVRFDNASQNSPLEVTVYFSIYSFGKVSYELWALIDDIYSLKVSSRYRLDFSKYESGLLQLTGDQLEGKEEVVMVLSYNTTGQVGVFKAEAAVDQIPNSEGCCLGKINAVTVGAFNKIMKLPPITANQTYFILIEGQKGTKFTLHFYDATPSAPSLTLNASTVYLTDKPMAYSAMTTFSNVDLPLFIQLNSYSGYGLFAVNYCNGYLETTFQNINGQNEEISITPAERLQCKTFVQNQSSSLGLLVENIQIELTRVYELGFEIGLFEGRYESSLRLNEQKYGVFLADEGMRGYPIEIVVFKEEISVRYVQITQSSTRLKFGVEECRRKKNKFQCVTIKESSDGGGDLAFTPQPNHNYNLNITALPSPAANATSQKLQFLVQLQHEYQQSTYLSPFRLYTQEVSQHQYNFYRINLTRLSDEQKIKIQNNTQLVVTVSEINGDIYTLSSLTVAEPTYEKYLTLNESQHILFSWDGRIEMLVDESIEMIYLAVKGNSDSLYQLQFTIDVDADIPAKYQKLAEGVQNNFMLSKEQPYLLLSFTSHILPYKVYIANTPKCIKIGHSLPLDQTCQTALPDSFSSKVVYLNVSNNSQRPFKFSVFVNSGEYLLTEQDALMLGCPDSCYEVVTVLMQSRGNVIHEGRGQIYEVDRPDNVAYNSFLGLQCESYPCHVKINATLPYGGEMSLFLEGSGIKEVDWKATPITFGTYPKKFIYPLRPYADLNSLLIYSSALQLDIYYNIVNIHETQTNIQSYSFPDPSLHDGSHSASPLRQMQVLDIDEELIVSRGCRQGNSYCLVTLSLYPNLKVEYNEEYLRSGVGYISASTYQIHFPINVVYTMEEQFAMSSFVHRRGKNQIFSEKGYTIQIEPLSDCHPKIYYDPEQGAFSSLEPNYQDLVVNYYHGWINFTILSQKQCRYTVALTNSLYPILGANRHRQLKPVQGKVSFLFRSEFSPVYKVQVSTGNIYSKINYIAVNEVDETLGFIEATPSKADFSSSNSNEVEITSNQGYSLYLVTVGTNATQVDAIIRSSRPVILSRNQEESRPLKAKEMASYHFSSTGSLALFLSTSESYLSVLVNKNYNRTTVSEAAISPRSEPWLHIKALTSELITYDLTITNQGLQDANITVLYEEDDNLSYQTLYEGIINYDAFVRVNQKNCYTFQTQLLLGRKTVHIDLVAEQGREFNNIRYAVTTKDHILTSEIKRVQEQPAVFRITAEFVPKELYTLCLWTTNASALAVEYYLLLNDPALPHLVESVPHLQLNENQYDMYELVEEGYNELVMIQVTSCMDLPGNDRILLGSSSFIDSEMGRYTDLVEVYKTKSSIYAQLEVQEGYYYLGVKNELPDDLANKSSYVISYQNITRQSQMMSRLWELPDTRIVKIYTSAAHDSSSGVVYHVELPEIVLNNDQASQQQLTITYHLVMLTNSNDTAGADPLEIEIRCPGYARLKKQSSLQQSKQQDPVITRTVSFSYDNQKHFSRAKGKPLFNFTAEEIPAVFNITGKVQISASGQVFSFYYDNSVADMSKLQGGEGVGAAVIVTIIAVVLIIAGVGVYVVWTYTKGNRSKEEKNLEMLSYTRKQEGERKSGKYGVLEDELN